MATHYSVLLRKGLAHGLALVLLACAGAQAQTSAPVAATVALGARTYATQCATCHQANGRGVSGAFPPLAGHIPTLLATDAGRGHVLRAVLFGLEGPITVNGTSFAGNMPALGSLDDAAIAAVLNYIGSEWPAAAGPAASFKPVTPTEVAAMRSNRLGAQEVYALRQKTLTSSQPAPAAPAASMPVSFTAQQVAAGKAAYQHDCMDCHGNALDNGEFGGAPLRGSYFRNRWNQGSVANLYAFMKAKMPPDRPGALSDKIYAELLAFILQANGFEPGATELPTNPLVQQSMSLRE